MGVQRTNASSILHWEAYQKLADMLPDILEEGRRIGHDVDRDPLLALDPSNLLRRYLVAEDWQVDKAAQRLRSTIAWRRDWRVMEYYRPGCGNYLYDEISNPGSEMYFADSMHVDRQGRPYMVGRVNLCNGERMHPWRHLRAGIYALDRFALKIIQNGCGYGSYLLDIGRVAEQGKFSGTGGGANFHPQESKNPYYLEGAGKDASSELLERYGELNSGMSVLRAALRIAGEHYPELLSRVVFLRSDWLFSLAFKVFRLWAHKKTRDKFLFVGGRADPPMTQLLEWYRSEQLPQEFGGQGYCLDGDVFLRRAVDFLDTDAKRGWDLPDTWNTEISLSEFASTDAKDAGEAAKETSTTFSQIFNPFEACCCSNSEPSTPARRRTRSNMVRQPETGQARAAMSTRGPASLPQTSRFSSISINSRSFLFGVIVLIAAWATFDQLLTTPNGDTFRET